MNAVAAAPRPAPRRPFEGRAIAFFSAVPWDFALAGRTRSLALGLSRLGAAVTFVEPPSRPKSAHGAKQMLFGVTRLEEGVPVLPLAPTIWRLVDHFPLLPSFADRLSRARLSRLLPRANETTAVVSTPRWAPVLEDLEFEALFYDCIDDLAVHASAARLPAFELWERELISRARGSFAVTPSLVERLTRRGAKNVLRHGNGVACEAFATCAATPPPHAGRKRLGYLGALYDWVDFALLTAVAKRFADCELLLIGPTSRGSVARDLAALRALPNVRLPGYLPYSEVPRAMASFDVALIPFKEGPVARGADPIKIYEYFAAGRPVVTTPVSDAEQLVPLLYSASGEAAFCAAIEQALAERTSGEGEALARARKEFAARHDWAARAESMGHHLFRGVA